MNSSGGASRSARKRSKSASSRAVRSSPAQAGSMSASDSRRSRWAATKARGTGAPAGVTDEIKAVEPALIGGSRDGLDLGLEAEVGWRAIVGVDLELLDHRV